MIKVTKLNEGTVSKHQNENKSHVSYTILPQILLGCLTSDLWVKILFHMTRLFIRIICLVCHRVWVTLTRDISLLMKRGVFLWQLLFDLFAFFFPFPQLLWFLKEVSLSAAKWWLQFSQHQVICIQLDEAQKTNSGNSYFIFFYFLSLFNKNGKCSKNAELCLSPYSTILTILADEKIIRMESFCLPIRNYSIK